MTKDQLLITIENYNRGLISFDAVETAIDSYSSALLQQTPCTVLLPDSDNDDILDIALSIVFLKYNDNALQDEQFSTDLGMSYNFIQKMIRQ